jgi:hypothetical protein
MQRGRHNLHFGGDFRWSDWRVRAAVFSYGEIDFPTFRDFLLGNTGLSQFLNPPTSGFAHLGTGLTNRDAISTDYHVFVQDDWKVSPKFTLNLGLRYELDLPPYDSQGRIGGFDPTLYQPPLGLDNNGPPAAGIVEAGNALPQYSLPNVLRVGKRIVRSIDPNNLGPRTGFAWSPLNSGRLAIRAGYGIFYSRPSFSYLALGYLAPPFFLDSDTSGQPLSSPFATAPPDSSFPLLQPGSTVDAEVIDRNARTPYIQQFNLSLQYEVQRNMTLQIAYVGSRGVKLFRGVAVNQARIASLNHPITNAVTGQVITDNTPDNASLRAPLQGVSTGLFSLNQSSAQSNYNALQTTLSRRFTHKLQFSASYTFSKAIDNASLPGGGVALGDGTLDRSGGLDTAIAFGNQFDSRANRGVSDFDRKHYFVFDGFWDLPRTSLSSSTLGRLLFSDWHVSTIVTAMSGLPVDVYDAAGGSLYGFLGGDRPNWAPGADSKAAMRNVSPGYYFNPAAFMQAIVEAGQPIPSAHDPTALAGAAGTDIGNVGRNALRGSSQSNIDFSVGKLFPLRESRSVELRADFFNLLNHPNRDNPISDIRSANFGKVLSFSSSPRIIQLALKFAF